ncbi:MAG: response regulator [bacterium]
MTIGSVPATPAMKAAKAQASPRVILIVDDEPDVLESFRDLLEQSLPGITIRTAASGAAALTMLNDVDLIVADYRMPEMDGIGLLSRCLVLRPEAKRILVTAFPGPVPELENRARREAKVASFVSKGLGPHALVVAVRAVLFPADTLGAVAAHT